MSTINKYLIEGLDRLGKDTLISGIRNKCGYHQVIHFSKPEILEFYRPVRGGGDAIVAKREMLYGYQRASFINMFNMLNEINTKMICNRAHLGEAVYSPLYRGYDGNYVFDLERSAGVNQNYSTRLILLTEDFDKSEHFEDDGLSFDVTKRAHEQELFMAAFETSIIKDKRIICVTDQNTGGFRSKEEILAEVLG